MAFVLKGTACEHCESAVWTDTSGQYDATTNPTGYGFPGGPSAYTSFTSYTLEVYRPGTATTGTADLTVNLLTTAPAINADGNPEWTLSAATLGEDEPLTSGVWYFRATGVFGGDNYYASCLTLFVKDVETQIDDLLKVTTVPAPMNKLLLCAELFAAKSNACCGAATHAQEQIDWIYDQLSSICC